MKTKPEELLAFGLSLAAGWVIGKVFFNRMNKQQQMLGNPWWDYGQSWSNMRLSPEFRQHERPLLPTRDGTDLAVGKYGGVQSDPYYAIDYNSPGYDYYRGYIYPEPPARIEAMNLQDVDFVGPQESAFASMITDAYDRAVEFIKGV